MVPSPFRPTSRWCALAISLVVSSALFLGCEARDSIESIRQRQASGDFAATVEPLRERLAENSTDGELNYLYGRALVATGEIGLATWPLRQAMEDDEWRKLAAMQLAHVGLANADFNEVVHVTTRLLEDDPQDATALLYRAQAQAYWRRDYEAALADATRAMEIDPDLIEAYEPRILALIGLERVDEAGEMLAEAGRRLEEIDADASVLAWHCSTTAMFEDAKGDPESARETHGECLERYPADPTVVTNAVGFYDAHGDVERSIEVLRGAFDEEPGQQFFRGQLAVHLRVTGKVAEGEQLLREATEVDDSRLASAAWLDLAGYLHAVRQHASAADAIERAIEETRKFGEPGPQILFQWADALVVSGQLDRAAEVADEISVPAQRHMILGRIAQERGDAATALAEFDQALRVWPDNPWARYYTARAAEKVGDFDRALEEYRYAIRIAVGATDARTRAAKLLIAEGQLQRAYQLLFLDVDKTPLEPEGELLGMYLMARAANPKQLQNAIVDLAQRNPARVPLALARGAEGAAEIGGPRSALGLLRTAPGVDYTDPGAAPALRVLVRLAHAAGEPDLAREAVDAALRVHPDEPAFHGIRGLHLELSGAEAEEIHAAYVRAVEGNPGDAESLAGLGRLAVEADPERALVLFDRAANADPSDPAPMLAGAKVLLALGRISEATSRLETLLERHPYEAEAAAALVELDLASGVHSEKTLDRALRAARFGGSPEAYEQLSEVFALREESERAEQAARYARELREHAAKAPQDG